MLIVRERAGWLYVDLRKKQFGEFGQVALELPAGTADAVAQRKALEVYVKMRERDRQLDLLAGAPKGFELLRAKFFASERFRKPGTKRFYEIHSASLGRMLGDSDDLAQFAGTAGTRRVDELLRLMEAEGCAYKTRDHRVNALKRLLYWGKERGWAEVPAKWPRVVCEAHERRARTRWCTEVEFWQIMDACLPKLRYAALYSLDPAPRISLLEQTGHCAWAFYTGAHKSDCDSLAHGVHVEVNLGTYLVRNTKNERYVHQNEADWRPIPGPMMQHIRSLRDARGKGWKQGELLFGHRADGTVHQMLRRGCALAAVDPVTLTDFRRSFATLQAAAGVPEHICVHLMGHSSADMCRQVYRRVPRGYVAPKEPFAAQRPAQAQPANVIAFPVASIATAANNNT